ncbi:hypothetical protein FSP39_009074 [Pinctada imbricata]|uniref:Uncharacterized protein n=1 Tax=Pinctada imbricata TaxID=66713 RepID=A0AA89BZ73_PINIB|nr:hypothetical protein FSP39_009074 [Pinctada imbricata]
MTQFQFIPFGYGPRSCIGMRLALLEAKIAIVAVLKMFRFLVGEKTKLEDNLGAKGLLVPTELWSQSSTSSQSPSQGGSTSGPRSERSEASPGVGSLPTCNYCKKKGHVIGECLKLKKKKELKSQACASVRNDRKALDSICSDTPEIQGSKSSSDDFVEDHYKPFLSQGFVSLSDSSEALPVQILRDTGAAQTLLLEGSLPLSEHTFTGRSVLLQGVEQGVIDVPLHKIYLKSDLITGPVIVGVRPTLLVQGVSLLLGNDLAGGKVVADPIVCEKITSDVVSDDKDDDLYPACAVTRAMARNRLKEAESTSALNEDHPSENIDLSDTFMSTIDDSVPETSVPLHVDKSPTVPGDDSHPPLDSDTDALRHGMTIKEILSNALIFFFAGYETTAATLSFLSFELAHSPDIQDKLYQEVMKNVGEEEADYENVSNLPYLDMCINETLRKYPPAIRCMGGYTMDVIASTAFGINVNSNKNPQDPFVDNASRFVANEITSWKVFVIRMTFKEILANALIFFFAGYETTAATLSFLSYELAHNQDIQDKLYKEIMENIGEEEPGYDNVSKLPYLEMCINETLRKYPPAFRVDRICTRDTELLDFKIPRGMIVTVPIYAIHHSPDLWEDPETYDPNRFLPENKATMTQFQFIPFGYGPRNCIGMRLALLEAKIAAVAVLKKFRFLVGDKTKVYYKYTIEMH